MSHRPSRARAGALVLTSFAVGGLAAGFQDTTVADALVDQADPTKTIRASSAPQMGDLLTKSETLWYDAEKRRLGIGTEPQTTFGVYGNARIWTNHQLTDNIAQGALQMANVNYTRGWSADPTGFQSYGGVLELNPRGLNPVEVNNALRVMPNGFVGLGVENPAVPFDMQGAFRTNDTIVSTKPAGAPFQVASTDLSANLNADLLDGFHADAFSRLGDTIEGDEIAAETITGAHIHPDARIPGGAIKGTFPQAIEFLGDVRIGGTLTFGDGTEIDSASGLSGSSSTPSSGPIGFQETFAAGAIAVAGADVGHHESLLADLYVEDTNARVSVVGSATEGGGASLLLSRTAPVSPIGGSGGGSDPLGGGGVSGGGVGGLDPFAGAPGLVPPSPVTASSFGGAWTIEHRATGESFTPLEFRHSRTDALDGEVVLALDPNGRAEFHPAHPNLSRIDSSRVELLGERLRLDPYRATIDIEEEIHLHADRAELDTKDEILLRSQSVILEGDLVSNRDARFAQDLTVEGDVEAERVVINGRLVLGPDVTVDGQFADLEVKGALNVSSSTTQVLNDLSLTTGDVSLATGSLSLGIGSVSAGGSGSFGGNGTFGGHLKSTTMESHTLDVMQANIVLALASKNVTISSSEFKQDVEDLEDARELARGLRGVRYRDRAQRVPGRDPEGRRTIGLIAEEVAEVLPEVVHFEDGEPAGIEYGKLTALLLEVVKEQDDELVAQRTRIDDLEAKLAALDARLAALEDQ